MQPFEIIVETCGKKYRLQVERQYLMPDLERFLVKAKNHTFLFDCNRPILQKKNLEHLPWTWTMVAGNCPQYFRLEIEREISRYLRRLK